MNEFMDLIIYENNEIVYYFLDKEIDKETKKSIYFTTMYGDKMRYEKATNKIYKNGEEVYKGLDKTLSVGGSIIKDLDYLETLL